MTPLAGRSTLNAQDIADVLALVDLVANKDGTAPLSEPVLMHLRAGSSPAARHLLARADDPTAQSDGRQLGHGQLDLRTVPSAPPTSSWCTSDVRKHEGAVSA